MGIMYLYGRIIKAVYNDHPVSLALFLYACLWIAFLAWLFAEGPGSVR